MIVSSWKRAAIAMALGLAVDGCGGSGKLTPQHIIDCLKVPATVNYHPNGTNTPNISVAWPGNPTVIAIEPDAATAQRRARAANAPVPGLAAAGIAPVPVAAIGTIAVIYTRTPSGTETSDIKACVG
jgi:hypothetical protein